MTNILDYIKSLKFMAIICVAMALLIHTISYERHIKHLEKETQAQQIIIETNNKLLEKQQAVLKQNQQLQKKLQMIEMQNKKEQEQIKKTLQEADLIEEKQVLLNSLWD